VAKGRDLVFLAPLVFYGVAIFCLVLMRQSLPFSCRIHDDSGRSRAGAPEFLRLAAQTHQASGSDAPSGLTACGVKVRSNKNGF
jgi:hypothetical protein